jgi:hypothetical protein
MDFSTFSAEPFMTLIRIAGGLFATGLVCAFFLCSRWLGTRLTYQDSSNAAKDSSDDNANDSVSDSTDNSINDSANDSTHTTHIYKVNNDMFDVIINSYKVCTCIIPSDVEIDNDANGIITCSDDPARGVIMFEVQDVYYDLEELIENDFADDRNYPSDIKTYYYVVFARIFTTRVFPDEITPNAYGKCDRSEQSEQSETSDSEQSDGMYPTTAFYYVNLNDIEKKHNGYNNGTELQTLSTPGSPVPHEKNID